MASRATGGSISRVNTFTSAEQDAAAVTTLADGGWLVTWTSELQDGSGEGIYQQRYDSDGKKAGSEAPVNGYTAGDQNESTVTALADGGWVVSWTSFPSPGETYGDLFQRRFDADGIAQGADTRITSHVNDNQRASSITALVDGGWVVTWKSDQAGTGFADIYQQRYSLNGTAIGGETVVNTYASGSHDLPDVAGLPDGGWLVSWSVNNQDGSGTGIFQRRYGADGVATGSIDQVNNYTESNQISSDVTVLEDGGWVVTWVSYYQDSGYTLEIFQRRYNADGTAQGRESRVNTETDATQWDQAVAALADGGWVVTWTAASAGEVTSGVYQQRYDEAGNRVGAETLVGSFGAANVRGSDVTAFADGSWVVTWSAFGVDGSNSGVSQRRFAPDVVGTRASERLDGTKWNETLLGYGGNDTLDGKTGSDILMGGSGNDIYVVNSSGDQVQEATNAGTDTVKASISYTLKGSVENLTLTGSSAINGTGNAFANALIGNSAVNILKGDGGADRLTGGVGADDLTGGAGADRFLFAAGHTGKTNATADSIFDFSVSGGDIIDLSAIDASTASGSQAFTFISTAAFSGVAGQLRYVKGASDTYIYGDVNGDRATDLVIHLDDALTLGAGDFQL